MKCLNHHSDLQTPPREPAPDAGPTPDGTAEQRIPAAKQEERNPSLIASGNKERPASASELAARGKNFSLFFVFWAISKGNFSKKSKKSFFQNLKFR